jgi:hypothetical protein
MQKRQANPKSPSSLILIGSRQGTDGKSIHMQTAMAAFAKSWRRE